MKLWVKLVLTKNYKNSEINGQNCQLFGDGEWFIFRKFLWGEGTKIL